MAEHRIYFFKVQGKSWNPNLEQFFWKSIPSDLCNRRDLGFFIFKAMFLIKLDIFLLHMGTHISAL
jgi:hypothetical protein